MSRCFEHNIFGPGFCPVVMELNGISAKAVLKAGCGGDYRVFGSFLIPSNIVAAGIFAFAVGADRIAAILFNPCISNLRPVVAK